MHSTALSITAFIPGIAKNNVGRATQSHAEKLAQELDQARAMGQLAAEAHRKILAYATAFAKAKKSKKADVRQKADDKMANLEVSRYAAFAGFQHFADRAMSEASMMCEVRALVADYRNTVECMDLMDDGLEAKGRIANAILAASIYKQLPAILTEIAAQFGAEEGKLTGGAEWLTRSDNVIRLDKHHLYNDDLVVPYLNEVFDCSKELDKAVEKLQKQSDKVSMLLKSFMEARACHFAEGMRSAEAANEAETNFTVMQISLLNAVGQYRVAARETHDALMNQVAKIVKAAPSRLTRNNMIAAKVLIIRAEVQCRDAQMETQKAHQGQQMQAKSKSARKSVQKGGINDCVATTLRTVFASLPSFGRHVRRPLPFLQ